MRYGNSWTGWCPICYSGPLILGERRAITEHTYQGRPCDCPEGVAALTWEQARERMRLLLRHG